MNKRGQLYLVAALIIAALLIGVGAIYNYARASKEDKTIYDLSKEIDYETSRVIDRGVFKGGNINVQVENITEYYASLNPRTELAIIFGNFSNLTAYYYKLDSTGTTCINTGSQCSGLTVFKKEQKTPPLIKNDNNITIILGQGAEYEFTLISGQNFYIVLIKEKDDEKFVIAPEQIQS